MDSVPEPVLKRIIVTELLPNLLVTAFGLSLTSLAQAEADLDIETYAGLTITGEVGKVYSVEYVNELGAEDWECVEFVQLLESPHLWTDKSAPVRERRFYRAVQMDAPTSMVWIPPGTFRMGSPTNEVDRFDREGPQTQVTLSRGFFMGKYEVTQSEWAALMGNNPSWFNGDRTVNGWQDYGTDLTRPVESVSWYDSQDYCAALTASERAAGRIPANSTYRLPTEAEWDNRKHPIRGRWNRNSPCPGSITVEADRGRAEIKWCALDDFDGAAGKTAPWAAAPGWRRPGGLCVVPLP